MVAATPRLRARKVQELIWSGLGAGTRRWWSGSRATRLADPRSAAVTPVVPPAGIPVRRPCRDTTPPPEQPGDPAPQARCEASWAHSLMGRPGRGACQRRQRARQVATPGEGSAADA